MSTLSLAPMMDVSDRWFRRVMRVLAPSATLYTEMVVAQAVHYGDKPRLLDFHPSEHPVVLQLGGDDPVLLAHAAQQGEAWGYDAINLNCGCPSSRVQAGDFGAILMRHPEKVARLFQSVQRAVRVPVTVKCRIGVDELDAYDDLLRFVDIVADAGCFTFIVHARKAWLQGLSPKENRTVPPLRYPEVWRLKQERPHLAIEINGGIADTESVRTQLAHVDGVMIGRAAIDRPWWLAELDRSVFGGGAPADRFAFLDQIAPIVADAQAQGLPGRIVTHHLVHLFAGLAGARTWRRALSAGAKSPDGGFAAARALMQRVEEVT